MGITTVPTDAYRNGDLTAMLTGRNLGTDFAGRAILQNAIYDPATTRTDSSGRLVRDLFAPMNVISPTRIDSVSAKILAEMPRPNLNQDLVNNYSLRSPFRKLQNIPSIKIDHSLNDLSKISGYYSQQSTVKDVGQDGLPDPISIRRDLYIMSRTLRVNFDQTITPTLLFHLGAGVQRYNNPDATPAGDRGL